MNLVLAAWEQVYGLLVEDGQIAIGTLVSFALAAGWSAFGGEHVRDAAGPLLFVLLMCLLLVNLYATGRKAYARRVDGQR
jgi:4-hydroxybenzoate polyprenyltransferase